MTRGGINLIMAAKARAMLAGQVYVSCEDVASVAHPVLRHRIIPNFSAQSEGVTADDIIDRILEAVPQDTPLD
jgi:MoxR-like ATPase